MSKFSAPINPERPRGAPACAKCSHLVTRWSVNELRASVVCGLGRELAPCSDFHDASVERTQRRGLKDAYYGEGRPA